MPKKMRTSLDQLNKDELIDIINIYRDSFKDKTGKNIEDEDDVKKKLKQENIENIS